MTFVLVLESLLFACVCMCSCQYFCCCCSLLKVLPREKDRGRLRWKERKGLKRLLDTDEFSAGFG